MNIKIAGYFPSILIDFEVFFTPLHCSCKTVKTCRNAGASSRHAGNATGRVVDKSWSSKVKERTDDVEGNCHGDD
jgi:hypothetical protein